MQISQKINFVVKFCDITFLTNRITRIDGRKYFVWDTIYIQICAHQKNISKIYVLNTQGRHSNTIYQQRMTYIGV